MATTMDAYIDLQAAGIVGESQNAGVTGAIPIQTYSFGTTTQAHALFGTGSSGAVKSEIAPLTVTYAVNSATPAIWINSLKNTHISKVSLYLRKNDGSGTPHTFLQLDLEQALITSVSTTAGTADAAIPQETLTIVGAKGTISYTQQNSDGSLGTKTQYSYDQRLSQQV